MIEDVAYSRRGETAGELPLVDWEAPREYWVAKLASLVGWNAREIRLPRQTVRSIVSYWQSLGTRSGPQFERDWRRFNGVNDRAIAWLRKVGWVRETEFPGLDRRSETVLLNAGFVTAADVFCAIVRGDFEDLRSIRINGRWQRARNYGPTTRGRILAWVRSAAAGMESMGPARAD